jgi:hypothetical protein
MTAGSATAARESIDLITKTLLINRRPQPNSRRAPALIAASAEALAHTDADS